MKLFTKKNKDNNDNRCKMSIEQQLDENIFKHKNNSFEAQKSRLCTRINCKFGKKMHKE